MTKKERLMAVLNHQQPDHIPVGFWFHFPGEDGIGEKCVKAHLDYYRETDIDFVKIMSDHLGYPLRCEIGSADDWFRLEPLPENDPFFRDTVERCRAINDALQNECHTFYTYFSPVNIVRERDVFTADALQGRNYNAVVAEHIRQNPEAVAHAMRVIAEDHVKLAEMVIREGGCLGIYQSLQGAEHGWLTEAEYNSVVKPSDLIQIEGINRVSRYQILHMCSWAGTPNHLSYWKDYPCAARNWGTGVEGLSLAQGLGFFGRDAVMLGGMDNRTGHPMVSGTREEIRAAVRQVRSEMKDVPFILGADCTLPATIDRNHIRWAVEAARE